MGRREVVVDGEGSLKGYGGVATGKAAGLFKGDDLGNFNPKGKMTRAQAAAVLHRLDAIDGTRYSPVILPR